MNTDIIFEIILNFSYLKLLIHDHDAQAKSWVFYFYLQTVMLLLLCMNFKEFPIWIPSM